MRKSRRGGGGECSRWGKRSINVKECEIIGREADADKEGNKHNKLDKF
jgi:hypothetical protein